MILHPGKYSYGTIVSFGTCCCTNTERLKGSVICETLACSTRSQQMSGLSLTPCWTPAQLRVHAAMLIRKKILRKRQTEVGVEKTEVSKGSDSGGSESCVGSVCKSDVLGGLAILSAGTVWRCSLQEAAEQDWFCRVTMGNILRSA